MANIIKVGLELAKFPAKSAHHLPESEIQSAQCPQFLLAIITKYNQKHPITILMQFGFINLMHVHSGDQYDSVWSVIQNQTFEIAPENNPDDTKKNDVISEPKQNHPVTIPVFLLKLNHSRGIWNEAFQGIHTKRHKRPKATVILCTGPINCASSWWFQAIQKTSHVESSSHWWWKNE